MARTAKPSTELSRRDVLRLLSALGVGSSVTVAFGGCSCSDDEASGATRPADGGLGDAGPADAGTRDDAATRDAGIDREAGSPLAALDDLRALLRTSPDHLQARAEDVVRTKDPTKIAEFVRDNVTVLPGIGRDDDPWLATESRWGAAATLRAGAGSLRDRADLMVMLLAAAGIPSVVKGMPAPAGLTAADLYRSRTPSFSIDREALRRFLDVAGTPDIDQTPAPPDDTADLDVAVATVLAATRSSLNALPQADLLVPPVVPVVLPDPGNAASTATVLVAVADQAVANVDPTTLVPPPGGNLWNVDITVSALMNPPAGGGTPKFVELVKGSWPIEDVIGHQAQILFIPPGGTEPLLTTPLSSFHVRTPMIRVQPRPGPDLDRYAHSLSPPSADAGAPMRDAGRVPPKTNPSFIALGSTFSVEGEVVTDASGAPGASFLVLDDTENANAVARVTKISGTANGTAFPTVELDLSITDAAGDSVDGLGAGDLVVTEGGATMPITVVANKSIPHKPRVLISFDASTSVTDFWTTPAERLAFEQAVATALTNAAALHPFDVQVVGLAAAPPESGWAPPTVNGLTTAMGGVVSMSDVWATFVGPALDDGPAAIIMISDFVDPDPSYIERAKKRLARGGVPVIAIGAGLAVEQTVQAEIVSVSSGLQISATDPNLASAIGAFVDKAVAQKTNVSYRVRYQAPSTGGSPRSVTVALQKNSTISATLSYEVPPATERLAPPSVAAVYLTISFAGFTDRRRLGGAFVSTYGNALQDIDDPAVVADARSVLDGLTTIAIEPAAPTLAAVLDDIVLAHQSLEPWREVWGSSDANVVGRAAARSYRFPGLFAELLPAEPPDPTGPIVIPRRLRVAVLQERARDGKFLRQIDLPPRLNSMRALKGGATDLEAVMRASLRLSANEALVFDETAFGQLARRAVVLAPGGGVPPDVLAKYTDAKQAETFRNLSDLYWDFVRLVPNDGGAIAFWAIDTTTGSVTAVDAAGRGGGESSGGTSVMDAINFVIFVLGLGCSLGVVPYPLVCLGLTVASVALTVAALFTQPVGPQTPFGVFSTVFGATVSAKKVPPFPKGGAGLVLLLIILYLIAAESQ